MFVCLITKPAGTLSNAAQARQFHALSSSCQLGKLIHGERYASRNHCSNYFDTSSMIMAYLPRL
jgi:hypothetical protein